MNKFVATLFITLSLFSTVSSSCVGTIVDDGPDLIKFGLEIQEDDYDGLGSFIASMSEICDECDLECGWLNVLAKNKKATDSLGCISGLVSTIEGIT